jgi:hypothetical protein
MTREWEVCMEYYFGPPGETMTLRLFLADDDIRRVFINSSPAGISPDSLRGERQAVVQALSYLLVCAPLGYRPHESVLPEVRMRQNTVRALRAILATKP